MFKTPLDHFDVIIKLKTELLPFAHTSVIPFLSAPSGHETDGSSSSKSRHKYKAPPSIGDDGEDEEEHDRGVRLPSKPPANIVCGFDAAALFLQELQTRFSRFAHFFYDDFGGAIVGVVWKPGVRDVKEFSVSNTCLAKPVLVCYFCMSALCVSCWCCTFSHCLQFVCLPLLLVLAVSQFLQLLSFALSPFFYLLVFVVDL